MEEKTLQHYLAAHQLKHKEKPNNFEIRIYEALVMEGIYDQELKKNKAKYIDQDLSSDSQQ